MSTQTTVAVTGATGFVGRHVTQALIDAGHHVRALVRDAAKARTTLPREGVTWVQGDVNDGRVAAELVAGARAVAHCIGIRREYPPEVTFDRVHVRATRTIVEAAQAAGVPRMVHISALGTRPDAVTAYHRSKFESETIVRKSGLRWTILRPSLIHGHDSEIMKLTKDWVLGRAAPWLVLPYFVRIEPPAAGVFPPKPKIESAKIQPVHIDDVAGAVVASLHNEETVGEVYPLGGPETLDWPTFLTSVRDALPMTEKGKKPAPLPGVVGFAMAKAAELIGMGAALPFGPSEPMMAIEDNTCSTDKARAQLGFRPRAFLSTMREYAGRV
jgi:NADH dehydrogenase